MSEANGKSKKSIWVNFTILAFLLVSGGFTLTACQKSAPGDSTKQEVKKNQPAETDKKQETGQDKLGGKSLKQKKKGQSANSDQRPNEETINDDDPE
jgi:flagellar basal body-associated protein FliL